MSLSTAPQILKAETLVIMSPSLNIGGRVPLVRTSQRLYWATLDQHTDADVFS